MKKGGDTKDGYWSVFDGRKVHVGTSSLCFFPWLWKLLEAASPILSTPTDLGNWESAKVDGGESLKISTWSPLPPTQK